MRNLMQIVEGHDWTDRGQHTLELVIGGQIINLCLKSKKAEMDGGPFYSGFDLKGETEEELKADAVQQAFDRMKEKIKEFLDTAKELGIDLQENEE